MPGARAMRWMTPEAGAREDLLAPDPEFATTELHVEQVDHRHQSLAVLGVDDAQSLAGRLDGVLGHAQLLAGGAGEGGAGLIDRLLHQQEQLIAQRT